ncbi:MAG: CRISPR-associated endonuclease Cas1 [Planctomycetaceae bacterium]
MPLQPSSVAPETLHLTGSGRLKVTNGRLRWSDANQRSVHINPQRLRQLFIYDEVTLSDRVMQILFEHRVEVAWLSPGGRRCRGRLIATNSTVSLRMLQHEAFGYPAVRLNIARHFVKAKLESQLSVLRRAQRNGKSVGTALSQIESLLPRVQQVPALAQLRGMEGTATRVWFKNFGALLLPPWTFPGRVRRPPTDPVNALLSLAYTWLTTRITAQLEGRGFEIQLGTLHDYRPGRPALSCDVIEPLRVPIVDRWVLRLFNRRSVNDSDFVTTPEKGTRLVPQRFRDLLKLWEEHLTKVKMRQALDEQLQILEQLVRSRSDAPSSSDTNR